MGVVAGPAGAIFGDGSRFFSGNIFAKCPAAPQNQQSGRQPFTMTRMFRSRQDKIFGMSLKSLRGHCDLQDKLPNHNAHLADDSRYILHLSKAGEKGPQPLFCYIHGHFELSHSGLPMYSVCRCDFIVNTLPETFWIVPRLPSGCYTWHLPYGPGLLVGFGSLSKSPP